MRHGEVDLRRDKKISAQKFAKWMIDYDDANIKENFSSKDEIKKLFDITNILVCSKLKRSLQSIEVFNKKAYLCDEIFNEAPLPYLSWNFLKLNSKMWLVFLRILWLFSYSKNCKSIQETRKRAKKATQKLIKLSKDKNVPIILIGHGVFNKLIKKELLFLRWKEVKKSNSKNWDYGIFDLDYELF